MKSNEQTRRMKQAIRLASRAEAAGDVPIGCVIVYDGSSTGSKSAYQAERLGIKPGSIIGRGYNRRNADGSALQHAEVIAIRQACRKMQDWRLEDCTMYVTLEPCPMCAGAIVQARIPRVVIGCRNEKAGCCGSVLDLLHQEKLNHQAELTEGICEQECRELMQKFFRQLREQKKQKKEAAEEG